MKCSGDGYRAAAARSGGFLIAMISRTKKACGRPSNTEWPLCDLPQYSPDLNPIEMPFSAFKAFLRKVSERTVRGLCRRIGSFVPTISRAECRNYFRHAGYASI